MTIKYDRPKILIIDLPDSLVPRLRDEGFNAYTGSFGNPYWVPMDDSLQPVIASAKLPNYTESEVIFIDLTPPPLLNGPEGDKVVSEGELDWWAKCSLGKIDPRPRIMTEVQPAFDRILQHGGVFVIFVQPRMRPNFVLTRCQYGRFRDARDLPFDNWSFLSLLKNGDVDFEQDNGTEIVPAANSKFLYTAIQPFLKKAQYTTAICPSSWFTNERQAFIPLLLNKFLACVGGMVIRAKSKGIILLLPQVADKEDLTIQLLKTVLPEMCPHVFPHFEGNRWLERTEYEHPTVLAYRGQQLKIQQEARSQIEQLDHEIEEERDRLGFLHGILHKTGDELVEDVKHTLEFIGFQQVKNVDAEGDASTNKQEDLQVLDPPLPLLLEVKGLAGLPTESDTLQVGKYVLRRMKQWNKTDIRGVSIINHQRNLPALERDHQNVFTPQQVQDAEQHGIALLTTWQLFRLIRGMIRWQWPPQTVRGLFYLGGRLSGVPTHYTSIGTVAHFWDKISVVSIDVRDGERLRQGDKLGFSLPDRFHEETAESLQVDNKPVTEVTGGQRTGHKTSLKRSDLPDGTVVFVVRSGA